MRFSAFARHSIFSHIALAACLLASPLFGDEPASAEPGAKTEKESQDIGAPSDEDLADERLTFMKSALSRFSVEFGDGGEQAKVSEPCLRWSNPVSGAEDGVLVVFTVDGGRPAAVSEFFHNEHQKWVNEFAVVATNDATILRSGRPFWKPSEYICKFLDVPDSPTPADKRAARLSQMRKIAADFSVVDHFGGAEIAKQNLRLLPQPAYRYEEDTKILDGALFVFALGTDPECNLLLEAYEDDQGARYRYAFVPMSIFQLQGKYKDSKVWEIERRMVFGNACRKYYALNYRPEPGEKVPD